MIKDILEISRIANPRTMKDVLCHVIEEVGEAATMINKPHGEYKETLMHEIADAIQCLVDLAYIHEDNKAGNPFTPSEVIAGRTMSTLERCMLEKNKKWKISINGNAPPC